MTTYRFKMHNSADLDGFINTLTSNGYKVLLRSGGNARILMCDVIDGDCKVRENDESKDRAESEGQGMTREEAIDHLSVLAERMDTKDTDLYVVDIPLECVNMAIEALEEDPCEDCISRQAVIERLKKEDKILYTPTGLNYLIRAIQELSSVKPQEPNTGHWEYVQYDGNPNIGNWHCSECNRIVSGAISAVNPVYVYKYCPNCGAKMEAESEVQNANR